MRVRPALVGLFALAAGASLLWLGELPGLGAGGLALLGEFARGALMPALSDEAGRSLLPAVAGAALRTVALAAAATGLAVALAVPLTPLLSRTLLAALPRPLRAPLWVAGRALASALRSVHELLWAILLLAALGLSTTAATLAIALPFAGMLARVYADLLDEADPIPAGALERVGGAPVQVALLARLPAVLPDAVAYTMYRFECGLRAAAVLGFFGVPTLGYHLVGAADRVAFAEVWTWLYALLALVVLAEAWSAAVRRRLVGP